jgi:hypothetical protein
MGGPLGQRLSVGVNHMISGAAAASVRSNTLSNKGRPNYYIDDSHPQNPRPLPTPVPLY